MLKASFPLFGNASKLLMEGFVLPIAEAKAFEKATCHNMKHQSISKPADPLFGGSAAPGR
jgi:hypothetical protein